MSRQGGTSNLNGNMLGMLDDEEQRNVLNDIYARATSATPLHAMKDESARVPTPPEEGGKRAARPWRQRVADNFEVRRQTPGGQKKAQILLARKRAPVHAIRLPVLPAHHDHDGQGGQEEYKEQDDEIGRPGSAASARIQARKELAANEQAALRGRSGRSGSNRSGSEGSGGHGLKQVPNANKQRGVKLQQLANETLNPRAHNTELVQVLPEKSEFSLLNDTDKLDLELFDSAEDDLTPQEWVALGQAKYEGKGTPARSLLYANRVWDWAACVVSDYDAASGDFLLTFNAPGNRKKRVRRLGVLFDDEDEEAFHARVANCHELREQARALRRYHSLVDSQSDEVFTPIQQSALHGIVAKLMMKPDSLASSREKTVELLIEVRDGYARAMKQAVIDHRRAHPAPGDNMEVLNLPAVPGPEFVPELAVVRLPPREYSLSNLRATVQRQHFTVRPEAVVVVLGLHKAWASVKHMRMLAIDELSARLPMSLHDYEDSQDAHLGRLTDGLGNEWRSMLINQIRDHLSTVFHLFVNDMAVYETSDLRKFLRMVSMMLRQQLADMATASLKEYVDFLQQYREDKAATDDHKRAAMQRLISGDVIEDARTAAAATAAAKHEAAAGTQPAAEQAKAPVAENTQTQQQQEAAQAPKTPRELLSGYLEGPSLRNLHMNAGIRPLFIFKMGCAEGKITFMPPLESISATMNNLLNVPSKLVALRLIDTEVVPLLGIPEQALLTKEDMPQVYHSVQKASEETNSIVLGNLELPRALASLYAEFSELLSINTEEYVAEWFAGPPEVIDEGDEEEYEREGLTEAEKKKRRKEAEVNKDWGHTLEETQAEIQKFTSMQRDIVATSPSEVRFRLILVECRMVKEQLSNKAKELSTRLLEGLVSTIRGQNTRIAEEFTDILTFLGTPTKNANDLARLKSRSREIEQSDMPRLKQEIANMRRNIDVLQEFKYPLSREDFDLSWKVVRYPLSVQEAMLDTKDKLQEDNTRFQKQLRDEQAVFQSDLEQYGKDVDTFSTFGLGTSAEMEMYAAKVEALQEQLVAADDRVASFQEREKLFGEEQPTEYEELAELRTRFRPYYELWSTSSLFFANYDSLWMRGPFMELDPEPIEKDVLVWFKLMTKLERELEADGAVVAASVAGEMRSKMQEFKGHIPLIKWLRSPGLRPRHWEQISALLGQTINPDHDLTLASLLALPCVEHAQELEDICNAAGREYGLEVNLDKMAKEWRIMDMQLEDYKDTGTCVLRGSEDILLLLDDQIMKTQSMRGSPYIKPFEARAKKWEQRLRLIADVMEQWLNCQKTWLYLEPIFSSEDIMRQIPAEGRRFGVVDAYWRRTMDAAKAMPNILELVAETENLLKTFQECNKTLDLIGKGLNDYLETKRLAFPRFYFLSADELLSILSQAKNAEAVQPHLNKCFDNMNKLEFKGEAPNQVIVGMWSAEKEYVQFCESIDPNDGVKKGNVELWLADVERIMKDTLHSLCRKALSEYTTTPRKKWVLDHAGQVVLAISQLMWTQEVEQALSDGGWEGLARYGGVLTGQLGDLVDVVRGKLDNLGRATLGALSVLDVHARDVTVAMAKKKVDAVTAFDWLSQLRYYWDTEDEDIQAVGKAVEGQVADGILRVKIINTDMEYGYEYLGNSRRLVITPLTDRCYRTLMGAIQLHLGGAPEGPAGTGKTETVKDLAKAVALQCVVFNGSDGLTVSTMGKFFKGMAAAGAWACFDEFNRIDIEVLSVVAQQVTTIQRAIIMKKATIFFEDSNIPVKPSATPFITMNPGYAGRAELPDNLKALFRTVAMMIPDYALIAEIVLYSCGYGEARELARKVTCCLRLSSEQLSSQDHYDFGMRCVNSILMAAGALRRKFPEVPEPELCLRAIRECNVPKFTSSDIPLFNGITRDLFPSVELKEGHGDDPMPGMIIADLEENNLQPHPVLVQKIMELYETVRVRHGLMLVGGTLAGKSTAIVCLQRVMSKFAAMGKESFQPVDVQYLSPKAITLDQLYGYDDENSHEWSDGILATIMRAAVDDHTLTQRAKWIVFDGPVDALWIENMNTVLDDNKKLCLASGEQIRVVNDMNLVFEVMDLAVASPATVSRCGMVFMEPSSLGWKPTMLSWTNTLPECLQHMKETVQEWFDWLIPPTLYFMRNNTTPLVPYSAAQVVTSMCNVMDSLLDDFRAMDAWKEECKINGKEDLRTKPKIEEKWLEPLFQFSLVWSLGCVTDYPSRSKFSDFYAKLLAGQAGEDCPKLDVERFLKKKVKQIFPNKDPSATVFDFVYDKKKGDWINWIDSAPKYVVPEGATYNDIIVPTIDTLCVGWVLESLIRRQHHVLLVGDTGTGKTVQVGKTLLQDLDRSYAPLMLSFTARTSANQTQDIIDGKLERRRAGVLGPPPQTKCVVFVDDLNMPAMEEYGAQPPIELLRQWMDYGGWYNRKENAMFKLVDIQFVTAMGPPGGGRNAVTSRYLRHFNTIALNAYTPQSLQRIFSTILGWWMDQFPPKVASLRDNVVRSTVEVYSMLSEELLPTPTKSHYTFNLRDVSRVFKGIMAASAEHLTEPSAMIRLFAHECSRVFRDRLINEADVTWFNELIEKTIQSNFKVSLKKIRVDPDTPLFFCDFSDPKSVKKPYIEITDMAMIKGVMEQYLINYNDVEKNKMKLVLFTAAVEHVSRISRIIRQPYGNALLVGVGGSGRQSLTRLAAFISEFEVFQVEVTKQYTVADWKDDCREMMRKAGLKDAPLVFLFTAAQIADETFIEDVNSILNNGEVPNLFPPEDYVPIIEAVQQDARKAGQGDSNASVFNYFVSRCKANIHVCLCLSPIGDDFRRYLRMYPSLVNCTTIDWFHPWPTEALKSVATTFLAEVQLGDEVKQGVVEVCVDMQERVLNLTNEYKAAMRRHNYVTPTSYLELIKIFRDLLDDNRQKIIDSQKRYQTGLAKLNDTAAQVADMQIKLEALQPELIVSTKETEELLVTIEARSSEVAKTREVVEGEERECNIQAESAKAIKDECEAALAEAMPVLAEALEGLRVLKKSDLDELKTMKVPSGGVILTATALCIMLGVPPAKVGEVGRKTLDYWEPAKKKLLSDAKFIQRLQKFDKDNIDPKIIAAVRPITQDENFQPAKVAKASKAAEGFCKWVIAMEKYDRVIKQVEPRRIALGEAEASLSSTMAQLKEKKDQLDEVQALLDELNAQLKLTQDKKIALETQVEECSSRLVRAEALIGGLTGEKARWLIKEKELSADLENVVGNILVSSGVVAYLGVFPASYRDACVRLWVDLLKKKNIPCADEFSLINTLGDPVQIRHWGLQQLPKDNFSVDNAIILSRSLRIGLMIDPQEQANKWIKNMETEGDRQLEVLRQNDDRFARALTAAVSLGRAVLIEGVGESLDPLLEPLLLKQTFKQGSRLMVQLGAEIVPYEEDFKLYLTTKIANPHYSPETTCKVTLINFMVTQQGLQDQMLVRVVAREEPQLEKERSELIVQNAEHQRQLQEIEDNILQRLNASEGNILDDQALIDTLHKSKQASALIEKRVQAAAKTQKIINKTRMAYQPVAHSAATLFFCISDLAMIDPMYQFSLAWFVTLFGNAIKDARTSSDVNERVHNIEDTFMDSLYRNVCRSLFEKDKLLFSFMLTVAVLRGEGHMDQLELRFLLTGGPALVGEAAEGLPPNPAKADLKEGEVEWLSDNQWGQILNLSKLGAFADLDKHMQDNLRAWKTYAEHPTPFSKPLPGSWERDLTLFQKMLILRCLRPDRITSAATRLVVEHLGEAFVTPPPFDLASAFADSSAVSPLVFVLSPGVDPAKDIFALAGQMGFDTPDKMFSISLGSGQGPVAENAIREAVDKGTWVVLQNCHLCVSWLPTLQKIVEEIRPQNTAADFRLWLTSMPTLAFPVSILQNGVKMTNEPPKGLQANLAQSYRTLDDTWLSECKQQENLKKLFFGLSFFHAVVLERKKFGSIGWNVMYSFTDSDLRISQEQLKVFLDMYESEVPFQAIQYLVGQLNYGGRVTDDWDRRCTVCILETFLAPNNLKDEHRLDSAGKYYAPPVGTSLEDTRAYIAGLPKEDSSELFGLHPNVDITCSINDTNTLFGALLSVQPRSGGGGSGGPTREAALEELCAGIADRVPAPFNLEEARERYPVDYSNSMNTVLVQELERFNKLLRVLSSSLHNLRRALKGEVVMSQQLEAMGDSMFDGSVPKMWADAAYPSLKPLGSWVVDLFQRVDMFQGWLDNGAPSAYWISGFFFTQSFLTGTMQNYARHHKTPIDEVGFDFEVRTDLSKDKLAEIEAPADGAYVYGLFLEGARWDIQNNLLSEPLKGQLFGEMPFIHLNPKPISEIPSAAEDTRYTCPVYKETSRNGVLTTTGHSSNFVLAVKIPSNKPTPHWVKRGVALFTQLAE